MVSLIKQHKNLILFFSFAVFILYGNSLGNKYAIDDDYVTVTNFPEKGKAYVPNNELAAKGFKGILKIWRVRYAHDGESTFDYRPVTSSSFAIEYGLFGQNPFVSHLINVLLYALSIVVLFCVMMLLFETYKNKLLLSTLIAFIFLILPIHTEVVNNLKSRDEILAFLFPLFAFWYCLKAHQKFSFLYLLLIVLFFFLGLYSKRSAMIFLGIIPLSLVLFRKVNIRHIAVAAGILIVLAAITVFFKQQLLSESVYRKFYHFENPMLTEHANLFEKLVAMVKTLGFYMKFSFIPYPFRNYYGTNVVDITTKPDLNLVLGILFLGGSLWYYLKSKNRIFLYGFLLFMGGILPFANLLIPVAGVVGERLAYNASFGISVMSATLILPLFKSVEDLSFAKLFKKPALYFLPLVVFYTFAIWMRNANWKDKTTLFEHDIEHLELSAKANSMLGNEYFEQLRTGKSKYQPPVLVQKALANYQLAIKNDSSFYSAYNNAGVLYFSYLQNLPEAERYLKLGLKTRPVYPQAYENLGNLYRHQNKTDEALKAYLKSIEQNPKQYNAYVSAIKICYVDKQYGKALGISRVAQTFFPFDYSLIGQEADCLFMLNRKKEALQKYEEAYRFAPSPELAAYLSAQYLELGDTAKSNEYKPK